MCQKSHFANVLPACSIHVGSGSSFFCCVGSNMSPQSWEHVNAVLLSWLYYLSSVAQACCLDSCPDMIIWHQLSSPADAGMEEHQLKELAYTIFFGACGKRSNAEHVQVMRAQLEVSSCANSSITCPGCARHTLSKRYYQR